MDSSISDNNDDHGQARLSKTERLELAYQETIRNTDLIVKDEGARRLRLQILLLENENDELHEQLSLGDDRADGLEFELEDLRDQAAISQEHITQQESQMRNQAREVANLRAELQAMSGITSDAAVILREKLALSREIAILKPELEHLRSQTLYQQTILAEKLALERQVSTLEVELESEKRASKRAAKKNDSQERETELQNQVDELQKELTREKRENTRARKEADAEYQSRVDELQKELARQKRDRKMSRDGAEINLQTEVEDLQKQLAREKREAAKALSALDTDLRSQIAELQEKLAREKRDGAKSRKNVDSNVEEQVDALEQQLAKEKKENEMLRKEAMKAKNSADSNLQDRLEALEQDLTREKKESQKAHKEAEKDVKASETQHAILESKLDQFRTKLRSTKEELKECQAELAQYKAAASKPSRSDARAAVPSKNSRKRAASEMDDDMAIGTPDGGAMRGKRPLNKKGRQDQIMVGEKSMFSITPFLNRTMSVAPASPEEEDEENDEEPGPATNSNVQETVAAPVPISDDQSPIPAAKSREKKKSTDKASTRPALGNAKANAKAKKPATKAARAGSTLEKVTEEDDENEGEQSNDAAPLMKVFTGNDFSKPIVSKPAPPAVEDCGEKKKKRKLGDGKTLFDEDDGEATKRPAKVNLGAPKLLSKGGLAGPKGGFRGGLGAVSGFGGFSPLKKDRRGVGASFLG